MTTSNLYEYHAVILAGLLHDIGKFYQRAWTGKDSHAAYTKRFFTDFSSVLSLPGCAMDLAACLAAFHHSTRKELFTSPFLAQGDKDKGHLWFLEKIIKNADSLSCVERPRIDDVYPQNKKDWALVSVFSTISVTGRREGYKRYPLERMNPLANNPSPDSLLSKSEYGRHFEKMRLDFESGCKSIGDMRGVDFFTTLRLLDKLLEEYCWAVPSSTWQERADISLYDHSRSTAALAACLYQKAKDDSRLAGNGAWKLPKEKAFILVGGDFSGIQDYIFSITNQGSGGAAKRLRARSFYIWAFCEAVVQRILDSFGLPHVCNLVSAGGKFLILLPNTQDAESRLQELYAAIEQEIHDRFFNQFRLHMTWKVLDRTYGFTKHKGRSSEQKLTFSVRENLGIFYFADCADVITQELERAKVRSGREVLRDHEGWKEDSFLYPIDLWQDYADGQGNCPVCNAYAVDPQTAGEEHEAVCRHCDTDRTFGEKLTRWKYVGIRHANGNQPEQPSLQRSVCSYSLELRKGYPPNPGEYLQLMHLAAPEDSERYQSVRKLLANHVPVDTDTDTQSILTFVELAARSKWQDNGQARGGEFLGVLKADVDNLGLVFSKGFTEDGPGGRRDAKTVSRYLTLSRMLEQFFAGWVRDALHSGDEDNTRDWITQALTDAAPERLEEYLNLTKPCFQNIYTVFSGGDDMILVGPWETLILFTLVLRSRFRDYTGNSKSFTLSAGLSLVKPKRPIAAAVREADELLRRSKDAGKNRLTLFNTTTVWEELPELVDFFLFLDEKRRDKDSKVNSGFLYRFMEYSRMAREFEETGDIRKLLYISSMRYDVGRNLSQRKHELFRAIRADANDPLSIGKFVSQSQMPLQWTLYRFR